MTAVSEFIIKLMPKPIAKDEEEAKDPIAAEIAAMMRGLEINDSSAGIETGEIIDATDTDKAPVPDETEAEADDLDALPEETADDEV
jgi:hypothetical protein